MEFTIGRLRIVLISLGLALAVAALSLPLAGCGASAAQLRQAREAEYPAELGPTVYREARAAMIAEGYQIEIEDPEQGILISTWRWYSKEGMSKRENQTIQDGAATFRIGVELTRGPRGGIRVRVDGGAQGYTRGSPVAQQYSHGDPREPWWVQGKIDALTMAIRQRLFGREMTAAGVPPAQVR
jgi:hypothetical protein